MAIHVEVAEKVNEKVVPVPEQSPDQPVKSDPIFGVTVSITAVPLARATLQVAPQEMPFPDTAPTPVPALVTVKDA